MKITKQARREAKELFRACQVGGTLDEGRVREAVRRLLESKPRGYLGIAAQFQRLVKLALAERTARVESAVPLAPDLQASVRAGLARVYGPGLQISFGQKPALIGGLRIQVGSDVYDGSVRARLDALQERF